VISTTKAGRVGRLGEWTVKWTKAEIDACWDSGKDWRTMCRGGGAGQAPERRTEEPPSTPESTRLIVPPGLSPLLERLNWRAFGTPNTDMSQILVCRCRVRYQVYLNPMAVDMGSTVLQIKCYQPNMASKCTQYRPEPSIWILNTGV
jgi:hypothetical protein